MLALISIVVLALLGSAGWLLLQRRKKQLPKGYVHREPPPPKPVEPPPPSKARKMRGSMSPEEYAALAMVRDRYKLDKVPEDLDCVVIGSGVGGLFTAALLAKAGQRVLVLEAHGITGGCTHQFEKRGFWFDTGLHYVGSSARLLDIASDPDHKINWLQQGTAETGFVYDRICLAGEEPFAFRSGRNNLLSDLIQRFPADEDALRRYFDLVDGVARDFGTHVMLKLAPAWLQRLLEPRLCPTLTRHSRSTALQVVQAHFPNNKHLAALLLAQFGDHGLLPDAAPFSVHASIFRHYFDGGFYPAGGSQNISRALIPTIEKAGGRVLVKACVEEIIVCQNTLTAVGVRLKGGDVINARKVISSAGIRNTYMKLVTPAIAQRARLPIDDIQRIGPSVGHVFTFVGLDGSAQDLQLPSSNEWILPVAAPDFDVSGSVRRFLDDPLDESRPPFVFMSFPSVKDREEGSVSKSTCLLITEGNYERFSHLAIPGSKKGKRGDAYKDDKAAFEARLLNVLHKRFPLTRDRVSYVLSSTPLTSAHYLNAMSGESYGLQMSLERYTVEQSHLTRPVVSGISNLYLAGQDVVSCGIAGAMFGGVLAAHAVLGYDSTLDFLTGRNLLRDLRTLAEQQKNKTQ